MLLYWNNLAWLDTTGAAPVYSGSNVDVYWPVANLATYIASAAVRSSLTHDMDITITGTFLQPTGILLYGITSQTGSTVSVIVTTTVGGPTTYTGTWTTGVTALWIPFTALPGNVTAVEIQIPKNTALTYAQLAKVFIGTPFDTTTAASAVYGEFEHTFAERTNADYSVLGQKYAEARAQYFVADLQIPYIAETIQATMRTIINALGTFTPFFVLQISDANALMPLNTIQYTTLKTVPKEKLVAFGAGYIWGMPLSLEQQL